MTSLDFLAHLQTESARFIEVLRDADPDAAVPSCPEWKADDLLWHLTEVQYFWGSIVEERLQSPDSLAGLDRPQSRADLVRLFEHQSDRLVRVLTEAAPETPVWMWASDKTVGYIRRRQAHEALIHRLDAEQVTGTVTPLDTVLASDGVDEALDVMYGGSPGWGEFVASDPDCILVTATDTGATWHVQMGQFSGTDSDGVWHDEADVRVLHDRRPTPVATIEGPAADLDAWLWNRSGPESLRFGGDPETLARLVEFLAQPLD